MLKIINSLIFIYCFSIGSLFPPSIIPKTTLVAGVLLFFAILLNSAIQFSKPNLSGAAYRLRYVVDNMHYGNAFIPALGILLFTVYMVLRSIYWPSRFVSNLSAVILLSFFLVFIINTREYLTSYLKAYIWVVFVMSLFGVISFIVVMAGIYPIEGNNVNLSELTKGAFVRDAYMSRSYVWPYYLGLVVTGETPLDIFGYSFYRLTGWAHEPSSATIFVVPAILLLFKGDIINNFFIRAIFLTTIICFWLFCASVGSLLAVLILIATYILTTLYIKLFPFKMSLTIFLTLVSSFFFLILFFEPISESALFATKFDMDSHTMSMAINRFLWFTHDSTIAAPMLDDAGNSILGFHYYGYLTIWMIISLFLWIIASDTFATGKLSIYSIILMYLILHSMKGSYLTVYVHTSTYLWFFVAYFAMQKRFKYS